MLFVLPPIAMIELSFKSRRHISSRALQRLYNFNIRVLMVNVNGYINMGTSIINRHPWSWQIFKYEELPFSQGGFTEGIQVSLLIHRLIYPG